ncbi:MAG TPA: sigma 54-interacting transcriptional regulator [Polyangiales bacterium]|nr:sigma 54-interacting transcriptional regulator [Polyangiales bacterium]
MESLKLYRGDQLVREVQLGERPLEVGSALGCDLSVDDPEVAARHWLTMQARGTVVAYDVSGTRRAEAQHLPIGEHVALGRHHSVVRAYAAGSPARPRSGDTAALGVADAAHAALELLVGRGAEARRIALRDRPIHIGRDAGNELVLSDLAVSSRHCRIEPVRGAALVRDLGSSNGTFINGVRIERGLISAGASLQVGRSELRFMARDEHQRLAGTRMVAESANMLVLLAEAQRVASLPWPVLVHGESGSGKEGIAELLHEHGPRRGRPFVTLNAGGVPAELIESELFGHERGAFTGASSARRGVFEQADGGTLFLDEIGELPMSLQSRLLRVLDSGEIRRVGAEASRAVDVRLVCATHRDVRAMVAAGGFREDLYYRIARVVLNVPPLRARPEDVRAIAGRVLYELEAQLGSRALTADAFACLAAHPWPGNVRELRNVLSSAALAATGGQIEASDVERALEQVGALSAAARMSDDSVQQAVQRHAGNLSAAARTLGVARSTLRDRMKTTRSSQSGGEL